jgi:UDP-glucose 4-epimerase
VTGGAGFVGSHLIDALLERGHAVRVLGDLSRGSRENLPREVEFIYGDVTNPAAVEPAFDASTAAVYGESEIVPIGEQRQAVPLSAYGADKYGCEMHARIVGCVHGIPTVGLRFFNLYGRGQDARSQYCDVITIFANRLARGDPVKIFGDGQQVRDFRYIDDAISALCRALPAASVVAPVFNVCTGKGTTVQALVQTMATLYRAKAVAIHRPARSGEVRVSIGDPALAARRLGFTAKTALPAGLAMTFDLPSSRSHRYG